MNRMNGVQMAWQTAKPRPADGGHILIPFPGKTTISAEQEVKMSKQGK